MAPQITLLFLIRRIRGHLQASSFHTFDNVVNTSKGQDSRRNLAETGPSSAIDEEAILELSRVCGFGLSCLGGIGLSADTVSY